ncbi:MAG: DNA methyltransferase [bacterium]|nr:DNA methyltransferase [bacterium]
MSLTVERKLALRAAVNEWISVSFPEHRTMLSHETPAYAPDVDAWTVLLTTKQNGARAVPLGSVVVAHDASIIAAPDPSEVLALLGKQPDTRPQPSRDLLSGDGYEFRCGDGIEAAADLPDGSVDLLLTDPPYGISRRYTCEGQVPRRLRKDGNDFIMPRGHFGDWDEAIDPHEWTAVVLPKVAGWAVTFCAQAQIGTYCDILTDHGFVAVGPMVWQKTNPVPFNHKYKPVNAWEAVVVGKRSGTPFNGQMVHNVFVHKSPSPQHRIHPTQKPLPLVMEFVQLFSRVDDLVFDPFAGSATTVIAAHGQRRRVIAYERDQALFSTAVQRVEAETARMPLYG